MEKGERLLICHLWGHVGSYPHGSVEDLPQDVQRLQVPKILQVDSVVVDDAFQQVIPLPLGEAVAGEVPVVHPAEHTEELRLPVADKLLVLRALVGVFALPEVEIVCVREVTHVGAEAHEGGEADEEGDVKIAYATFHVVEAQHRLLKELEEQFVRLVGAQHVRQHLSQEE